MNRHLNLFTFYNGNHQEYIENNLSRAFALCLKNSPLFLDKILNQVLPSEEYRKLFSLNFSADNIQIDLQPNIDGFGIFRRVIGVGCSGMEFQDYEATTPSDTDRPTPDVSIVIGDVCLIFEFKPNESDPRPQVRNQVEAIMRRNESNEAQTGYLDLSWKRIVQTILNVLSLYHQTGNSNPMLQDFRDFLEMQFPHWFPVFQLDQINVPPKESESHPDLKHIQERLNHIKQEVYGKEAMAYIPGQFSRFVIGQAWGWAKEQHVNFDFRDGKAFIIVSVYPGDTKRQGSSLFKKGADYTQWPEKINGWPLEPHYYLKFSHFNSGLFWLSPEQEEAKLTHNNDFFHTNAGRWKRDSWPAFEDVMTSVVPGWRDRCAYSSQLENSNRNYFDLSMGVLLEVLIPYEEAQHLDSTTNPQRERSGLALRVRQILDQLKAEIDRKAGWL